MLFFPNFFSEIYEFLSIYEMSWFNDWMTLWLVIDSNLHNYVEALDCVPLDPCDSIESLPNVFFITDDLAPFSIWFTILVDWERSVFSCTSNGSGVISLHIWLLLETSEALVYVCLP